MSERVYEQVEDAIRRGLHLCRGNGTYGPVYCYPVAIERGDIVVRDSDCGLAKDPWTITIDRWSELVEKYGLKRQVGGWSFASADDPAADDKAMASRNPSWAGWTIYEQRQRIAELERLLVDAGMTAEAAR